MVVDTYIRLVRLMQLYAQSTVDAQELRTIRAMVAELQDLVVKELSECKK